MKNMKCVDLFSGCGGFSLGVQNAGIDVVAAFEYWDAATCVYKNNFAHPVLQQDLSDEADSIKKIKEYSPNLIIGGPPCQDFSLAGAMNENNGRAILTTHFANIVCSVNPEWFIMENVPQINKSKIFTDAICKFEISGYGLTSVILDASFCGVPQARRRMFLIGHAGDSHNQLLSILQQKLSVNRMSMYDYFGNSLGIDAFFYQPRNYKSRGVYKMDAPAPTMRGVNGPAGPGFKLETCAPSGVDFSKVRPLTTIERSYVQTFPKDFKFSGTKTSMEKMIGNAVPVNLGTFVASAIKEYMKTNVMPSHAEKMPFILATKTLIR